jgi:type IV pilus assembly protein PilB
MSLDQKEELEFNHGAAVIKQGDPGSGFYILLAGAVEVYRDDVLMTVLMFPGTIFGEMADILGKPRTCTVKAKGKARLHFIPNAKIENLLREQPDIAMKIIKTLATRLDRTTQKVADQFRESPMWTVEGAKRPTV